MDESTGIEREKRMIESGVYEPLSLPILERRLTNRAEAAPDEIASRVTVSESKPQESSRVPQEP
ncbi:MAG: hypothetical protein AAF236_02135 [Verrucomicrobiota bacterium]